MAIVHGHVPFHDEIYRLPGVLADPVLTFGVQHLDIRESVVPNNARGFWRRAVSLAKHPDKWGLVKRRFLSERAVRKAGVLKPPEQFNGATSFADVLENYGAREVVTLDYMDSRADIQHDMNLPIGREHHERYGTLIDIGAIEHVFDTAQCLENCLRMIRVGGHYVLHTPVGGYFDHGLHVFNAQGLVDACRVNGFKVIYRKVSNEYGAPVNAMPTANDPGLYPSVGANLLLWLVARKERPLDSFKCPQQGKWELYLR